MNVSRQFEIVIVGGGIVGSTLALALSRAGVKTALIEKESPARYTLHQDYDLRVSAISLASEYLFRNLRVWDEVASARISPYKEMHVWNAAGSSALHFDSAELQQEHLGHIIENSLLQSVLLSHLQQEEQFELISPAEIELLETGAKSVAITLKNNVRLKAQLLIGADGADSSVRNMAAIDVDRWSYNQFGLVSTIATAMPHRGTAWQRFLPQGPIALLPLVDNHCSIVWTVPDEEARRLQNIDDNAFCKELTQASAGCLGDVVACGRRAAFPLKYQHAKSYVSQRLALVGDAAHVVHPLAGQGVNMGLLDAVELAQLLVSANSNKADLGSSKLLRRYARARRGENTAMGLAFDALNRIFSIQQQPLSSARDMGMNIVDRSTWLKRYFMQKATGLEQVFNKMAEDDYSEQGSLLTPPEFR